MCPPHRLWCGGGHTRRVERGCGVSSEDARHCSVLYLCKHFVLIGILYYSRTQRTRFATFCFEQCHFLVKSRISVPAYIIAKLIGDLFWGRQCGACRGLTRATYILCIEHPRPMRLSRESNPGPPALQGNTLCKEPLEWSYWLLFGTSTCTTTAPPQAAMSQALDWGSWLSLTGTRIYLIGRMEVRIAREGARRSNLYCVRGSRALEPQNSVRIASRGGLTRATYILCIEHPRPMCLSWELNPGLPALQANTLCKELFERRYWLLFGTSACTTTGALFVALLRF